MIDLQGVDWERLRHPSAHLNVMVPTPEKLVDLSDRLLNTPMYLPDEHRNEAWVDLIVASLFNGPTFNWVYEVGDWDGIFSIQDIWPGYRAETSFLLWNNKFTGGGDSQVGLRGKLCWGADFVRELRDVIELVMSEFQIKRLGIATPEENTVRIATKWLGFKVEGTQKYGFRFDGKMFTQNLLRRVKE